MADDARKPVLEARGIVHAYAGKRALDGVDLCLRAGEVHALMGQNGAGKSTLIKVLTGVELLQAGNLALDGESMRPTSTLDAQRLGISTVYQEVNLCPNLSVAENIFAGRQPLKPWSRGGGIDWRTLNSRAQELLKRLDVDIDVRRELGSCSVALQQMVAIARAIDISARVLILDEPTSSLDTDEVAQLFKALRSLRESGMGILFVTHFLDQVYEICDRITVLRNGKLVGEYRSAELDHAALVAAMVGRAVASEGAPVARTADSATQVPVIRAQDVERRGGVARINLEIRPGEILGFAGLLARGARKWRGCCSGSTADAGEIYLNGERVRSPILQPRWRMAWRSSRGAQGPKGNRRRTLHSHNIVLSLQAAWPMAQIVAADEERRDSPTRCAPAGRARGLAGHAHRRTVGRQSA